MIKITIKIIGCLLIIFGVTYPICYLTTTKISSVIYQNKVQNKLEHCEDYFAILEIPKINLQRELYSLDSKYNTVNNLLVHKNSVFPNENKSNVIIAGHSGHGKVAHFHDLYKLTINDEVKLYYNGNLYIYEIKEIEIQAKTGTIYLKENYDEMITLITCTKNNPNTQTVYYGKLKYYKKL